jgi:protein FAM32A
MSEAYENVVGGGLKLKGGIKKKKKKSQDQLAEAAASDAASSSAGGGGGEGSSSSATNTKVMAPAINTTDGMTESERRRRETMLQRELAKAEKGEVKSHREKVKDFNNYLASMTEHYDLPKVSKGN